MSGMGPSRHRRDGLRAYANGLICFQFPAGAAIQQLRRVSGLQRQNPPTGCFRDPVRTLDPLVLLVGHLDFPVSRPDDWAPRPLAVALGALDLEQAFTFGEQPDAVGVTPRRRRCVPPTLGHPGMPTPAPAAMRRS